MSWFDRPSRSGLDESNRNPHNRFPLRSVGPHFSFWAGFEKTMAEATKTRVEPRDPEKNKGTGTRVARRLRKKGLIPAVIYGHKQAVVPVTLTRDEVWRMLKTPGHLADLDVNGTAETVLIRDMQWDHLGKEVLHLDFARVSAEEMIDTEVSFEVKGSPAGLAAGGILEHLVHSSADHVPGRRHS